MEEQRITVRRR